MGEIADGLIDGTFDSITGEYLGEGPGYPRTNYYNGCVNGVRKYLKRFIIGKDKMYDHCHNFVTEVLNEKSKSWTAIADTIQDNWDDFANYSNEKLTKKPKLNKK